MDPKTMIDTNTIWLVDLLGNSLKAWITALVVFILSIVILKVFKGVIISKMQKLSEKTKNEIDDMVIAGLGSIHWPFYVFVSFYFSLNFLSVPAWLSSVAYYIFLISIVFYSIKIVERLIDLGARKMVEHREGNGQDVGIVRLMKMSAKIFLWAGAVILLLSNMGYNVTSLVAGLGIGGVAVALAVQNILSDLFSSLSIYFDKPFKIGDFIIVGSDMGVVQNIGIKSTRIQTLQGQELVISNSELTSARVNNYGKMAKRRIVFEFGVTYDTPKEKLEKIPAQVKAAVESQDDVEFDRAHFRNFADSSLMYEVVYYLNSGDYNRYMDTQQAINLALVDKFEKEKVEFAFPTQTVYVKK